MHNFIQRAFYSFEGLFVGLGDGTLGDIGPADDTNSCILASKLSTLSDISFTFSCQYSLIL